MNATQKKLSLSAETLRVLRLDETEHIQAGLLPATFSADLNDACKGDNTEKVTG